MEDRIRLYLADSRLTELAASPADLDPLIAAESSIADYALKQLPGALVLIAKITKAQDADVKIRVIARVAREHCPS